MLKDSGLKTAVNLSRGNVSIAVLSHIQKGHGPLGLLDAMTPRAPSFWASQDIGGLT